MENDYGPASHSLNDGVDLMLLMSSKWFQGPPDAVSHVQDIKSAFQLFITPSTEHYILEMQNLGSLTSEDFLWALDKLIMSLGAP